MNSLGIIACAIGLKDSLNPAIFMTCAVFITMGSWLASSSLKIFWLRTIFVLFYVLSFLNFTFGPAQIFVLHKEFFIAAKIIYLVSSAGAFILGIIFLKDWVLLCRRPITQDAAHEKKRSFTSNSTAVLLITIILAVVLSALASIGPMNNYIMLLGNESLLKGQWQESMPLLLGYTIFSMWPIWFIWVLLSIKNLRPSLLKIICASIFFTASSCVILTFKL